MSNESGFMMIGTDEGMIFLDDAGFFFVGNGDDRYLILREDGTGEISCPYKELTPTDVVRYPGFGKEYKYEEMDYY